MLPLEIKPKNPIAMMPLKKSSRFQFVFSRKVYMFNVSRFPWQVVTNHLLLNFTDFAKLLNQH